LKEDDEFGLFDADTDLDIFKFKQTPKPPDRAEAEFIAQTKPKKEKNFERKKQRLLYVHQ